LERATELQRAAASRGFDWPDVDGVMPKLREELGELEDAIRAGDGNEHAAEELGDLLFTCANLARHLGVDAAGALRRANGKFERRFRRMEQDFLDRGESFEEATLEQMDASWESVKRRVDPGTRSP
jgi:ATP diphosphatase